MIEMIYGTHNPAKLQHMRKALSTLNMRILGLDEVGVQVPDVEENGQTPLENARIKATAYYDMLKRPVFACDSGFYLDGLPDSEQPGVHVRMVCGKRLSDEEMITYYSGIVRRLGGRAVARYKNAVCLVMGQHDIREDFSDDLSGNVFYLVDTPHPKRVEGFPLDSLSIRIESGNYYYDEERARGDVATATDRGFQAFFRKALAFE